VAICVDCDQEMSEADGCTVDGIVLGGRRYARAAVDPEDSEGGRCYDCAARRGSRHHVGCDLERCPACHWQQISCRCVGTSDDSDVILLVGDVVVHPPHLRGWRYATSTSAIIPPSSA
jgi:hypothetical protein